MLSMLTINLNGYHEELNKLRESINESFINKPTADVVFKRKEKKSIEGEFQKFLNTDRMAQGALCIYEEGTSSAKLGVTQFSKDVKGDFVYKGKKLDDEIAIAVRNRTVSQAAAGVGTLIGALAFKNNSSEMCLLGAVIVAGGIAGWIINNNKANTLPEHLKAVHMMEEKWNHAFKINEDEE